MTFIHRFSTKSFMNDQRLQDEVKLRKYIKDKRENSTDSDLNDFISVMHDKRAHIHNLLSPLKEDARKKTGAEAVVKAVRFLGGKSDNLGAPLNWFENKVVQVAAVPQAKLFVYGSYELSIHEGPSSTSSSGYRLELRLYSSEGAQILAASDEPLKGGPKMRLKV